MNVKRCFKIVLFGVILVSLAWILPTGTEVSAKSNLWMLEISEETAMAYNQLCVVDEDGHLYSLSDWVPEPIHKLKLKAMGVDVVDYATIYERKSYEKLVACTNVTIPVVKDDADLVHYYFTEESLMSLRHVTFAGVEDGKLVYHIDMEEEYTHYATVGPDGYSTYDLSDLEDGLYFVNLGGLVRLQRSK